MSSNPQLIRFATTNNTGSAALINYVIPNTSPLRRMFEGGGKIKFRLTSSYISVTNAGVSRALVRPALNIAFGYSDSAVTYHDAETASATFNGIISDPNWYLYFNSDQSDWIPMPNGQCASISATFIPPRDYTFAAGDNLYFFATLLIDQEQDDPFKNFLKP